MSDCILWKVCGHMKYIIWWWWSNCQTLLTNIRCKFHLCQNKNKEAVCQDSDDESTMFSCLIVAFFAITTCDYTEFNCCLNVLGLNFRDAPHWEGEWGTLDNNRKLLMALYIWILFAMVLEREVQIWPECKSPALHKVFSWKFTSNLIHWHGLKKSLNLFLS